MAFVKTTGEPTIGIPIKSVEKIEHGPTQGFGTRSSGQFKHCRLCLGIEHNMVESKFASKELPTLREANFQSQYGNRCRSGGDQDRRNNRLNYSVQ